MLNFIALTLVIMPVDLQSETLKIIYSQLKLKKEIYFPRGEIRNLMDTGAKNFRLERERNEEIQKMKEKQEEIYRQRVAHMKKIKADEVRKTNESKLEQVDENEVDENEEDN